MLTKLKKTHRLLFALLIGTSVIFFWRGLWNLLDIYFLPNNPGVSNLGTMLLGLLGLYTTHTWIKELEK